MEEKNDEEKQVDMVIEKRIKNQTGMVREENRC